jgi:hypothetical protein
MTWIERYAEAVTDTPDDEAALIMRSPVPNYQDVAAACFSADSRAKMNRVDRRALQGRLGRVDLVKVLTILGELDGLLSRIAGVVPATMHVHARLYGDDELAHVPAYATKSADHAWFMSFNLGHDRVRRLFLGVMSRSATAQSALTDLVLHEKAHQVQARPQATGEPTVHDAEFYRIKSGIKSEFVRALEERSVLDPFRRVRFRGVLASVGDVLAAFPESAVVQGVPS